MMHIVEEEQVPVTLFIVGQHVYGSREQTTTFDSLIASKYFEIANHSYTHAFQNKYAKFYTLPDSAVKDFIRCADSLHLTANIVRTP
ncbi:MAG: polysaccharide deacetylase family protein [Ferruginibacter sp.]